MNPQDFITVSRPHAGIKLADSNWQIKDLGTMNRTLVNDRLIDGEQKLESGDRITLGEKGPEFTFKCLVLNATVTVQQPEKEEPSTPESEVDKSAENAASQTGSVPSPEPEATEKDTSPESKVVPAQKTEESEQAVSEPSTKETEMSSASSSKAEVEKTTPEVVPASPSKNATTPSAEPQKTSSPSVGTVNTSSSVQTLWNLVSQTELSQLPGHSAKILALAFSPDGQILASAAKDKTIKLWNIATQAEIATLTGLKLAANNLAFSPDGKILASGGADKTIKLWNVDAQEETASFTGHKLAINALGI